MSISITAEQLDQITIGLAYIAAAAELSKKDNVSSQTIDDRAIDYYHRILKLTSGLYKP
jgi:hypothetical protein